MIRRLLVCFARIVALTMAAGSAVEAADIACPDQIRIAYTDADLAPYVLGNGAVLQEPPGLFVTWTRTALARMGCAHAMSESRLPYNRIIASMTTGTVDVRVTGGYRQYVLGIMRFPMATGGGANRAMAVAEADTRLYVLKDNPALSWDGKQLRFTGSSHAIGTLLGHYTEKVLQAREWKTESAPSWEINVRKLLKGRIAAIAGPDSVIDALPERDRLQMLNPPVQYDLYYAPVSRYFHDNHPAFTERFWLEICRESRSFFNKLPACSAR